MLDGGCSRAGPLGTCIYNCKEIAFLQLYKPVIKFWDSPQSLGDSFWYEIKSSKKKKKERKKRKIEI